ncbi:hypothetical protein [Nonomuraea recticatena]|uniref:hypothetical protein n=1 Tax=Nonomuraea recticatena TaxID=46178 RepID=UPI0036184519
MPVSFGERLAAQLRACVAAEGLKVWKDVGLRRRDHRGELVMLDDERLAPLWAAAGSWASRSPCTPPTLSRSSAACSTAIPTSTSTSPPASRSWDAGGPAPGGATARAHLHGLYGLSYSE